MKISKKHLKLLLKILVSAGFIVWIIFKVNWEEVFAFLVEIKLWQIALFVCAYLLGILISVHKWSLLAKHKGFDFELKEYFKYYLTGTFINNFMPSFIGGDTFRSWQIGKDKQNYPEAASTVMMDRVTGFVGATVLVIIFALLNWKVVLENNILLIANFLVALSFAFDIAVAKLKKIKSLKNKVKDMLPEKVIHFFRELWGYNNSSNVITKAILWGAIFNLVGVALANYVLFASLGIKISLINYLTVIFLISIVSSIPVSLNNIGIKEWAYMTFFGIFGVSLSAAISVAIISRFIQMLVSFFALPAYLQSRK